MEELLLPILRVAGYVLWFCLEGLFYQIFYYIGVIPVWILSFGKYPTTAPHNLSKSNRRIYGVIGFVFTLVMFWCYFANAIN
jgi:hypothetical protein